MDVEAQGRADTYVAVVMLLALLPKLLVFYLPLILLLLPSALTNYLYLFARADPRTPFPAAAPRGRRTSPSNWCSRCRWRPSCSARSRTTLC